MLSVMLNQSIQDYTAYILRYYNDSVFPYVTGLEIKADRVHSVCPGKVLAVGYTDESKFSVTVLVNTKQMIRYTHLASVDVSLGDSITFKSTVGVADKFVRFEYCTNVKGNSIWPVRIKSLTMYKQDPIGLLTGDIKLEVIMDNIKQARGDEPMIPLDKDTLEEFTGSRGDE